MWGRPRTSSAACRLISLRGADHSPKVRVMVGKIARPAAYGGRYGERSVVAGEQHDQEHPTPLQHPAQRRQNLSLDRHPQRTVPEGAVDRRFLRDGSQYFGPYASVYIQKEILEILRGIYQLRTCSLNLSPETIAKGRYSVCLEYHIGNCKGPWRRPAERGRVPREYRNGRFAAQRGYPATRDYLQRLMNEAAAEMRFEDAGRYKKRLDLLAGYQSKSVVVSNTLGSMDVFSLIIDERSGFL